MASEQKTNPNVPFLVSSNADMPPRPPSYRRKSNATKTPSNRPLIEFAINEWQNNPKYIDNLNGVEDEDELFYQDDDSEWTKLSRRRFSKRFTPRKLSLSLTLTIIMFTVWNWMLRPRWSESKAIDHSLDRPQSHSFGGNTRPPFTDLIQLKTLPSDHLPSSTDPSDPKRLIIVGDVHGCKHELVQLLQKVEFSKTNDHLVLTGDLIAKGPDSPGVIDLVRSLSASCVRGNHEDRMLLSHHAMISQSHDSHAGTGRDETAGSAVSKDRKLAREFNREQIEWLSLCPIILRLGTLKGMGEALVVHGGLAPGVSLERQDPYQCMNMRSIDLETGLPSEKRAGSTDLGDGGPPALSVEWTKVWNKWQKKIAKGMEKEKKNRQSKTVTSSHDGSDAEAVENVHQPSTVIYGHDSKRGLNIERWSKGLDTGCVNGGKLTALVIAAPKKEGEDVQQKIVSVNCKKYR
jgi:hypothetical protein